MRKFLFFLIGFFVLSSFSSLLLIDWLKLPLSIPEILLIPFLPFLKKINFSNIFNIHLTYKLLYVWISLITIAFLVNDFTPFQILSFSRGFLYLFLIYILFLNKNNFSLDDMLVLSLGSLFGWAVSAFFNFSFHINSTENIESLSYGALLPITLFISISTIKKKYFLLFVGLILLVYISLVSGLRRQILIFIVSLLMSLFFRVIRNPKTTVPLIFISSLVIFLVYSNFKKIDSFLASSAPILHYRVIEKTNNMIYGDFSDTDYRRESNFNQLFFNLDSYIFPKGFPSKDTSLKSNISIGKFIDFPLLLLSYIFGFPITLLLLIYFGKKAFNNFKFYQKYSSHEAYVFLISFLVILCLCFLDGTFLTFIYAIPYTGYCLARLNFYSNRINNY